MTGMYYQQAPFKETWGLFW